MGFLNRRKKKENSNSESNPSSNGTPKAKNGHRKSKKSAQREPNTPITVSDADNSVDIEENPSPVIETKESLNDRTAVDASIETIPSPTNLSCPRYNFNQTLVFASQESKSESDILSSKLDEEKLAEAIVSNPDLAALVSQVDDGGETLRMITSKTTASDVQPSASVQNNQPRVVDESDSLTNITQDPKTPERLLRENSIYTAEDADTRTNFTLDTIDSTFNTFDTSFDATYAGKDTDEDDDDDDDDDSIASESSMQVFMRYVSCSSKVNATAKDFEESRNLLDDDFSITSDNANNKQNSRISRSNSPSPSSKLLDSVLATEKVDESVITEPTNNLSNRQLAVDSVARVPVPDTNKNYFCMMGNMCGVNNQPNINEVELS